MAILSTLLRQTLIKCSSQNAAKLPQVQPAVKTVCLRTMSGHGPQMMPLTPSRWQWHKFKDVLHLYGMIGLIPATLIVFYSNVFIGPATLEEIPEGYTPKHWEYHRHPITRFLARYVFDNPQQEYEKFMHVIYEESERGMLRGLEQKIRDKMAERQDYKAYYYRPVITKYNRASKSAADELAELRGD